MFCDCAGGPEVKKKKKEYACQCRRLGFDPWSWKIPYVLGQLSLCTTTAETVGSTLKIIIIYI